MQIRKRTQETWLESVLSFDSVFQNALAEHWFTEGYISLVYLFGIPMKSKTQFQSFKNTRSWKWIKILWVLGRSSVRFFFQKSHAISWHDIQLWKEMPVKVDQFQYLVYHVFHRSVLVIFSDKLRLIHINNGPKDPL